MRVAIKKFKNKLTNINGNLSSMIVSQVIAMAVNVAVVKTNSIFMSVLNVI